MLKFFLLLTAFLSPRKGVKGKNIYLQMNFNKIVKRKEGGEENIFEYLHAFNFIKLKMLEILC